MPELQGDSRRDNEGEWHVSLLITSSHPPEVISAGLGTQPSRHEVDEEGAGHVGEDGEWETTPLYTWALDSRLPIRRNDPLPGYVLEDHIQDVIDQIGDSWMKLVSMSGWPDVHITLSASLPLSDAVDWEEGPDGDWASTGDQEAYFSLPPQIMASLSQILADLSVTYT